MITKRFATIAILGITAIFSILTNASVEEDIVNRLAPVGKVCMAGDPCAAAVIEVASGPRSGSEIYQSKCVACHSTGAAGAPKFGDTDAWGARKSSKGVETLYANAINGIGGMPAKGLCMDCSDEEINATVDYMLTESGN
ncbi:MAG: cytochrome c5 [Cellvibrionaceae bacterium]